MSDFFRSIVAELKDEDVNMAADGRSSGEFSSFIDTGCYMLNAVVSGTLFGGMADNKVLVLAGESSTGKTFVALGIVREFLAANPEAAVIYYDTESAITKKMMEDRGIDTRRVIIGEPQTLQDFRTKALNFMAAYGKAKAPRPPVLMVLDSLGMLSSVKELADTAEGKDTRDMTKAQLVRGIFRVLRLKLAKLHIPMIVTGHTYASVGAYVPTQELSGGGGIKYASDSIAMLRKSKDKDGTEVVGVILKIRMYKARLSRENQDVACRLSYDKGLDRFYGLLDFCEENGVVVRREGNKYVFPHIEGKKFFRKEVEADPERFWTRPVLELVDKHIRGAYQYGVEADEAVTDDLPEVPHDPDTGEIMSDGIPESLRGIYSEE